MAGVVTGMTMVSPAPRPVAARATPWAWLPAEAQTTPWASSVSLSAATRLAAPRILNEKTGCRSSRFRLTGRPRRADRRGSASSGVYTARSWTRPARRRREPARRVRRPPAVRDRPRHSQSNTPRIPQG